MQFVKVFVGPSGWGVTVYKLYAVYTCMGFMYNLLWLMCVPNVAATRPREVKFICVVWHGIVTVLKTVRGMSTAVAVIKYEIVVCTCSCMCTFVYLQTVRTSPLRHIGDVTEAETHQAADVEV